MRLTYLAVCLLACLLGESFSFWLYKKQEDCPMNIVKLDWYLRRMKDCLKEGLVVDYKNFRCHGVNVPGTACSGGQILVVGSADNCLKTTCVDNKDNTGRVCPAGYYPYKGKCTSLYDNKACSGDGEYIRPDYFGRVKCSCPHDLGLVRVEGVCEHEYLRGPCKKGRQLIRKGGSYTCRVNKCPSGQIQWADGQCYLLRKSGRKCKTYYRVMEFRLRNRKSRVVECAQANTMELAVKTPGAIDPCPSGVFVNQTNCVPSGQASSVNQMKVIEEIEEVIDRHGL